MALLPMHNFVSWIGHFENIGSLSYADLPNVDASLDNMQKSHWLNSPQISSKKVFKYWEAVKLMVVDTSLPQL